MLTVFKIEYPFFGEVDNYISAVTENRQHGYMSETT